MSIHDAFAATIEEVAADRGYTVLKIKPIFRVANRSSWQFVMPGCAVVLVATLTGTSFMLTPLSRVKRVYYDLSDPDSLNQIARSLDCYRIEG